MDLKLNYMGGVLTWLYRIDGQETILMICKKHGLTSKK
jgi:hypothetical protein